MSEPASAISGRNILAALRGQNRLRLVMMGFSACFIAITAKLGFLSLLPPPPVEQVRADTPERLPRPDLVDRNGQVLATDISIPSLYADPRQILDVDETVELLTATLPDLNAAELRKKLLRKGAFAWIKRELTPAQKDAVYNLGIPGLYFRNETRRIYPMGRLAAHVLGYVDVDSHGLAGVEKYLDDKGAIFSASLAEPGKSAAMPAQLSIDVRVQHALTDELQAAITYYQAKAGAGLVMDVHTGEIVGAVSLPDYNPNSPDEAQMPEHLNRFTGGAFELGSVVKSVTFAMALDAGTTSLTHRYDCRYALPAGRGKIDDFHATRRVLSTEEVFTHSSNIGTALMALDTGLTEHQAFLHKIGFFDRMRTEIPEAAQPLLPPRWSRVSTMTAAFGHGISIQPLQLVAVAGALMNGGKLIEPTFLKRDQEAADASARQIIKPSTSDTMRYLFRQNVLVGTGGNADIPGYRVGGKTGTAEKVVRGHYDGTKRLNSFLAAFPIEAPQYVVFVMLDEPQPTADSHGFATAGYNAVPLAGKVIGRIAPILGIKPVITPDDLAKIAKQDKQDVAKAAATAVLEEN